MDHQALFNHLDERHRYLCERLDQLEASLRTIQQTLLERLESHDCYHRENEHRWGLLRLAQRHPLRLAMLAFLGGGWILAIHPGATASFTALLQKMLLSLLN